MKNKFLALILTVAVICGAILPSLTLTARAAEVVDSGDCGTNVTWALDSTGTLTISGSGEMHNYERYENPWYSHRNQVKKISIENGVANIGASVFSGCNVLTNITIPLSVTSIGNSAFDSCVALTDIAIPSSVTSVGDYSFYGCTGLTTITIPNSMTSIGNCAFWGCTGLTIVTIPESVTSIGVAAFSGCTSLTDIKVDPGNSSYCAQNGVLFDKDFAALLCYPAGKTDSTYAIPNGVTGIGGSAFEVCTDLTGVTIPDSVTYIADTAFRDCAGLTNVMIPDSVTYIGWYAFSGCTSLTSVTMPNRITSIEQDTFSNCTSLVDITIPSSVTRICRSAFSGCTELKEITIPDGVRYIGYSAFSDCYGLTNITIPESVMSIDDFAFGKCTALQSMCFQGDAPQCEADAFSWVDEDSAASISNPNLTIYYIDGKEGWTTPMWNGYPTATWDGVNPPKHHEHDYKAVVTAPTCTEQGYTTHTCVCGDSYRDSYTNALGHDFIDHEAKAATCTEVGWEAYQTCSRCDYTTYKEIPVKGHTPAAPVRENEVAPTCTVGGSYDEVVYCSVCKKELSREAKKLDALGHDFIGHEAKAATCTEVGWDAYQTCSRCNYTTYKEISALGHDWGEPVYEWADDHSAITATRVCKRDPAHTETETGVVTSAVTKEATYDAEGEITYTAAFTNPAFEPQTAVVSLPRLERPTPTPAENPFTDIRESAYYHDPVLWAVANNVTNGTSDSTFSPDEGCTRAQVVTFLWRAAGKPDPASSESPFSDVKEGAYYFNAVLWAVETGITNGTSDTTFSPDETCTRAQIVTFLWRYEEQPAPAGTSNPFADVKPSAYFGSAVLWAVETGITNGTSATTFDPEDTCTRAQVVTFLYRDIAK